MPRHPTRSEGGARVCGVEGRWRNRDLRYALVRSLSRRVRVRVFKKEAARTRVKIVGVRVFVCGWLLAERGAALGLVHLVLRVRPSSGL